MNQIESAFANAIRAGDLCQAQDLYNCNREEVTGRDLSELLWDRASACDELAVEFLKSLGAEWPNDPWEEKGAVLSPGSMWAIPQHGRSRYLPTGDDSRKEAQFFADHGAPYGRFLLKAIEIEDTGVIEFILSIGIAPEKAFLHAVVCGCFESVLPFVNLGISLSTRNERGQTALHLCADPIGTNEFGFNFQGDKIATLLIAAGADINGTDNQGWTALHTIAWDEGSARNELPLDAEAYPADMARLAQVIIAAGADVNSITAIGRYTPLHLAAKSGNLSVAEVLVRSGADSTILDWEGRTAAEVAEENGYPEIVKLLSDVVKQQRA